LTVRSPGVVMAPVCASMTSWVAMIGGASSLTQTLIWPPAPTLWPLAGA